MEDLDWERIPKEKLGTWERNFISSYLHQLLPLHKRLCDRKTVGSPAYSMCGNIEDTENHFLRCKGYHDTEYGLKQKIAKILDAQGIYPHLKRIQLQGIGRETKE